MCSPTWLANTVSVVTRRDLGRDINTSLGEIDFLVINPRPVPENCKNIHICHNDLKFSDRKEWAKSVPVDQTAPRGAVGAVWSGSTLFAILSASFGHITLW